MEWVFRLLFKGGVKWTFLAIYTLTSAFHIVYVATTKSQMGAAVSIFTSLVDWVAILGFVVRKPILGFQFWRGWFVWSLVGFFLWGYGRDILVEISLDASLLLIAVSSAYYFAFFTMVYAYAYVEKEIWRY